MKFQNSFSKLTTLAEDKINVTQQLQFNLEREQKIVEKEENTGIQHFLFPQCYLLLQRCISIIHKHFLFLLKLSIWANLNICHGIKSLIPTEICSICQALLGLKSPFITLV